MSTALLTVTQKFRKCKSSSWNCTDQKTHLAPLFESEVLCENRQNKSLSLIHIIVHKWCHINPGPTLPSSPCVCVCVDVVYDL